MADWRKFTDENLFAVHKMTRNHWKKTGEGHDKLLAIEEEIYRRLDEQD